MTLPSVNQFMYMMSAYVISGSQTAAGPDPLLVRLGVAYRALLPYAPDSVRPVNPPWPKRALAFEATWADGRSFIAATRILSAGRPDSQLTLTHQGITKSSVLTTHQFLATGVVTCLGSVAEG